MKPRSNPSTNIKAAPSTYKRDKLLKTNGKITKNPCLEQASGFWRFLAIVITIIMIMIMIMIMTKYLFYIVVQYNYIMI